MTQKNQKQGFKKEPKTMGSPKKTNPKFSKRDIKISFDKHEGTKLENRKYGNADIALFKRITFSYVIPAEGALEMKDLTDLQKKSADYCIRMFQEHNLCKDTEIRYANISYYNQQRFQERPRKKPYSVSLIDMFIPMTTHINAIASKIRRDFSSSQEVIDFKHSLNLQDDKVRCEAAVVNNALITTNTNLPLDNAENEYIFIKGLVAEAEQVFKSKYKTIVRNQIRGGIYMNKTTDIDPSELVGFNRQCMSLVKTSVFETGSNREEGIHQYYLPFGNYFKIITYYVDELYDDGSSLVKRCVRTFDLNKMRLFEESIITGVTIKTSDTTMTVKDFTEIFKDPNGQLIISDRDELVHQRFVEDIKSFQTYIYGLMQLVDIDDDDDDIVEDDQDIVGDDQDIVEGDQDFDNCERCGQSIDECVCDEQIEDDEETDTSGEEDVEKSEE